MNYKILSPMTFINPGRIISGGDRLRIKGIVAAAVIFCMLTAFDAFTVPCAVEEKTMQEEWKGRDKVPGEKVPEAKDPETQYPGKEAPEKKDPGKEVPRKKEKRERQKMWEEFVKDPLTVLENRKEEIKKQLKEGRISREEADAILKRIETGIAEIKKFSALPLEEKRARLIKDCKDYLDSLVERGEMDRDKAGRILKDYTEKINKWDGTGYPRFLRKFGKAKEGKKERDL